ncbi:hypothetical protein HZI31_25950 [Serratia fonticola]|uniref:hypothetical protein n=1 Tax=Serratia fonticola TaxID=47917 RepID=UPI0015C67BF1|nr:hypothetical protein [Serratia fonticola]NXZ90329.1 hypothetical protein [Serratia fonticola]NYA46717.1 hypothetical protein [Serratia fonticola]
MNMLVLSRPGTYFFFKVILLPSSLYIDFNAYDNADGVMFSVSAALLRELLFENDKRYLFF